MTTDSNPTSDAGIFSAYASATAPQAPATAIPIQNAPTGPTGPPAAAAPAPPAPQTEQELRTYISQQFGPAMLAYLNHPELGPLLRRAANERWAGDVLKNALKGTDWWRSMSDTQRKWDLLKLEDPAEADRQLNGAVSRISDIGNQLGISFEINQARKIAEDALKYGWTPEQMNDVIAGLYDPTKGAAPGMGSDIEAMANRLQTTAAGWMVTGDITYFRTLAKRIATGEATEEGTNVLFQQQAKARFPWLGSLIDQGITPGDFFRPYRQAIATEMEVDEQSINLLTDPRWQQLLSPIQVDGQARAMTLPEAQKMARQRPEWKSTKRARQMSAEVGTFLLDRFGATG